MTVRYARFELPSTSGRHRLQFDLVDEPGGLHLRAVYETAIYGRDALEPAVSTYVLPPVKILRQELEALRSLCRNYCESMVTREAQGEGVAFEVFHEHKLEVRFEPGGAESGIAGWQALFSFQVSAGPSLTLIGRYVVDATCLDMFDEGLADCLGGVPE
jgi:hypothetical protein